MTLSPNLVAKIQAVAARDDAASVFVAMLEQHTAEFQERLNAIAQVATDHGHDDACPAYLNENAYCECWTGKIKALTTEKA